VRLKSDLDGIHCAEASDRQVKGQAGITVEPNREVPYLCSAVDGREGCCPRPAVGDVGDVALPKTLKADSIKQLSNLTARILSLRERVDSLTQDRLRQPKQARVLRPCRLASWAFLSGTRRTWEP